MPRNIALDRVLFYIDLKTGNIFLGWLSAIIYLVLSVLWIRLLDISPAIGFNEFIYIFLIITSFIHIINCKLFVIGIFNKSSFLILPWLIGQILLTMVYSGSYFIFYPTIEFLPFAITFILLQTYIWICGYSIYTNIVLGRPEGTYQPLEQSNTNQPE